MSDIDDALRGWLPSQRWFGGKGAGLAAVRVEHEERLPVSGDVRHTLVEVTDGAGGVERYQLLLGYRSGELEPRLQVGLVGEVEGRHVYDAVHEHEAVAALLELIAAGRSNGQIAQTLFLSPKTIRNNITSILAKLQATDRSEVIVRARDAGLGRD